MKTVSPDPHHTHPLDLVILMTGSSRRKILFYCRKGIVSPVAHGDWHFDEEAIHRLRHIETLRQRHRMNWEAIHTIAALLDEVEVLREELRFRR